MSWGAERSFRSACIASTISWACDMEATRVICPVFRAGLDSLPYICSAAVGIVSVCFNSSSWEDFEEPPSKLSIMVAGNMPSVTLEGKESRYRFSCSSEVRSPGTSLGGNIVDGRSRQSRGLNSFVGMHSCRGEHSVLHFSWRLKFTIQPRSF